MDSPPRKEKRGRPRSSRKSEDSDRLAFLYTNFILGGMTHDEALEKLTSIPWYSGNEGDGAFFVGKETIKKAIKESRKYCVTGDEFRSSKILQQDLKWKEMFAYLDSLKT